MSVEKKQLSLKIDLFPENLETLNNDLKRINDALNKACKAGNFDLKEAGLIGVSVENFAHLIFGLSNSAKTQLEKTNESLEKK
jgi:hypothetical protein